AYVGRLDTQKGVHLIRHALFYALQKGAQFVLLGSSPETGINDDFWHLKHELNDNHDCHLEIGYDEELAHRIYAGADMVVVPSLFEPCGLTQMIALRYGAVPIVRAVGGLADTVFDRDHSARPPEARNGYVFHEADYQGLESAMSRAIGLWQDYPGEFRELILNGLRYDYSWNHPGQNYLNIYDYVRHK
ncbi:MAG: glycosyltransferase, partial [Gammaproteobacteria bacterium]|nr:glycosyltransferase [Gammaproteobacteria bacterium]